MQRAAPLCAALLATWATLGSACPCCPTCVTYCPCVCETCGPNWPTAPPPDPTPPPGPWTTPSPTPGPWTRPKTTPAPTPPPGPLLHCSLNCYGDAATPVPLPGGNGNGIPSQSLQVCRDYCMDTEGCEAIVYGRGTCWGKKDVHTSKCQGGQEFVTEVLTRMPTGTCSLMGDPHILTFDNPNGIMGDVTQLRAGEYWLVQSAAMSIQARFGYSKRFPSGSSATGVAVGGALLANHKLTMVYTGPKTGYAGFYVAWDNTQILNSGFPASFDSPDGILKAYLANMNPDEFHDQARHTIGGTSGHVPSFLFEISPHIRIYGVIGEETVNLVIRIRRPDGSVDGYCGNFNCLPEDDTLDNIAARGFASPIADGGMFAGAPAAPEWQRTRKGERPDPQNCSPELMIRARQACQAAGRAAQQGCIFDVCAAGNVDVAKDDVVTAALQHEMTRHFQLFGFLKLPQLFNGEVSPQVQWSIAGLSLVLLVGGLSIRYTSWSQNGSYHVAARDAPGEASDEEALLGPTAYEHAALVE